MKRIYQRCVRCVMDTTDSKITFDENGVFSNNLITALVNNEQAIENLIGNLIYLMNEKGFAGLDIDFEYIYKEDRDAFTSFVAECTRRMDEYGIWVSVHLHQRRI